MTQWWEDNEISVWCQKETFQDLFDFLWLRSNKEFSRMRILVLSFFPQSPNTKSGFYIRSTNKAKTQTLFVFMKVKSSFVESLLNIVDMKRYNKNGINKARLPPWGKLAECFIGCRIDRDTEYRPSLKLDLFRLLSNWLELQNQPHDMMTLWWLILTLFSIAKINHLQKDTCNVY